MHAELIKANLRMRGTSCAAIAKRLRISQNAVSLVIYRRAKSARIERAIARALELPVATVFPRKP